MEPAADAPGPARAAGADLAAISAWTRPRVPSGAAVAGLASASAQTCGACHAEIAAEWAASTHAAAWIDPQFQAELHKDPSVAWLCIHCHTPLADQQERSVADPARLRDPESRPNPGFDPALREEGITCLSCHWRAGGIAAVHEDAVAPHPLVFDGSLRDPSLCTSCHQAMAAVEPTLVCHFDTGAEWLRAAPGKTCQECHMPTVERPGATGGPTRAVARHLWPGSLLPKRAWTPAEAAMFEGWEPGVALRLEPVPPAAGGAPTALRVLLRHQRAGHRVPTGDPERHLLLTAVVRDAAGVERARLEERIGQEWEWWPAARKLGDNRLSPGEERSFSLELPAAPGARVEAQVEHVRISDANAAYHQLGDYPRRRVVATAAWP